MDFSTAKFVTGYLYMSFSLPLITILTFLFFCSRAGKNVKNLGYLYAISQNAEVNDSLKEKKIHRREQLSNQVRTDNTKISTQMILDLDLNRDMLTPEAVDAKSLQTMDEFHCVDQVTSPTSQ